MSRFLKAINFPSRYNTRAIKWEQYKSFGDAKRPTIPLWVADADFKSADCIIKAVSDQVNHGVFGYSSPSNDDKEAVLINYTGGATTNAKSLELSKNVNLLSSDLQKKLRQMLKPSHVFFLPGLVVGLNISCRAFSNEGESVMTMTPIYPRFLQAPMLQKRKTLPIPMLYNYDNKNESRSKIWQFDFERIEHEIKIRQNTKERVAIFFLCNPQNPIGRNFSEEELLKLSNLCNKYGVLIVSDEIHSGLILAHGKESKFTPMLTVNEKCIVLAAPSKTYNIPNLLCSYAIIPDHELMNKFRGASAGLLPDVNPFGLVAMRAAFTEEAEEWRKDLVEFLRGNQDIIMNACNNKSYVGKYFKDTGSHEATYLAFLEATPTLLTKIKEETKNENTPVSEYITKKIAVAMNDGVTFSAESEKKTSKNFVRLNFGCNRDLLNEALDRLSKLE